MTTTLPIIETREASGPRPIDRMRELSAARRTELEIETRDLLDTAETEGRELTDTERLRYDANLEAMRAANDRSERASADAARLAGARPGSSVNLEGRGGPAHVTRADSTYRPDNGSDFLGDVARWSIRHDMGAGERLAQHAQENRDLSRTDGAGGDFVPPAWLMDAYAPSARAGRVFADRFAQFPLPGGTDTLNIPKVTTGSTVAVQTADNAAVSEVDLATDVVTAPVRTLAGQNDVALQLLEQSPIPFDRVVFEDLLGDYNRALDVQCLSGSAASGQLRGVLGLSGVNAVTYTDASPTLQELYPKGALAVADIVNTRFQIPEAWVMHPTRWMWMLATLDSSGRPYVVPQGSGPQNAPATVGSLSVDGPSGTWHGLPVFLDANIPTNLGAGTNEDRILCGRFSDGHLYESQPRLRVLPEVGSGTLTVRIQLYNYVAFAPGRFAGGMTIIAGTGLATPTF